MPSDRHFQVYSLCCAGRRRKAPTKTTAVPPAEPSPKTEPPKVSPPEPIMKVSPVMTDPVQPPKTEFTFDRTFDRSMLRGYAEKMRKAEEAAKQAQIRAAVVQRVEQIASRVLETAKTDSTFYLYAKSDPGWMYHHQAPPFTDDDLLRGLREKFVDCVVSVAEEWVDQTSPRGQSPTRVLKSGIKIDWS